MATAQDQTKLKKRLEALLKLPENQVCSDCRKRGPRWASANLGVFFCIECSGIHRNLGVHISFVRSVNLDTWTKPQVDFMEEWGNGRANEYFEASLPNNFVRPKEGDPVRVVERFIRDKYELRKYCGKEIPPKRVPGAAMESSESEKRAAASSAVTRPRPTPAPSVAPVTSVGASKPAVAAPVSHAKPAFDLLDMDSEPAAPPAPPVPAVPAAPAGDMFGNFAAAAPPVPPQQANNGFAAFDSPAAQANNGFPTNGNNDFASMMAAPQKPAASNDAILSLFAANNNAYGGRPMMGGMPPQMGGMPPQMGGMPPQMMGGMPHMGAPNMMMPQQPQQQMMGHPNMMMQQGFPPQMGGMPMQQQQQQQQPMGGMGGMGGMPPQMGGMPPQMMGNMQGMQPMGGMPHGFMPQGGAPQRSGSVYMAQGGAMPNAGFGGMPNNGSMQQQPNLQYQQQQQQHHLQQQQQQQPPNPFANLGPQLGNAQQHQNAPAAPNPFSNLYADSLNGRR